MEFFSLSKIAEALTEQEKDKVNVSQAEYYDLMLRTLIDEANNGSLKVYSNNTGAVIDSRIIQR